MHLDQSTVGDWNEIDAVELIGEPVVTAQLRQWASGAQATSQYGTEGWSAWQATGAPNTSGCGDMQTAWASAEQNTKDTLTLQYDMAVVPAEVNIYQTYNPGSIVGVDLVAADGSGVKSIPNSADPDTTCPHVFKLQVPQGFPPVNGVTVHLDQSAIGQWNEIDAVELVGQ